MTITDGFSRFDTGCQHAAEIPSGLPNCLQRNDVAGSDQVDHLRGRVDVQVPLPQSGGNGRTGSNRSRQPMFPQVHSAVELPAARTCPRSPAEPCAPRLRWPSETIPVPIPVAIVTNLMPGY